MMFQEFCWSGQINKYNCFSLNLSENTASSVKIVYNNKNPIYIAPQYAYDDGPFILSAK